MSASILLAKLDDAIRAAGDFDETELLGSYVEFLLAVPIKTKRRIERANCFVCPPESVQGLSYLEQAIKNGDDLLPWMSKNYQNGHFYGDDDMMHLYGVTHFHLGTTLDCKTPQKISRTGNLLYAYVKDDVVYELNICGHGEWYNANWQEILISNWPNTFKRCLLGPDVLDVSWKPEDDEQIKKLTKAGVCTILRTGAGYSFPIGGGVTTAKTSALAMPIADRLRINIARFEKTFSEEKGIDRIADIDIRLDGRSIVFVDKGTDAARLDILNNQLSD